MIPNLQTRASLLCVRVSTALVILSLVSMAQASHSRGSATRVGGGGGRGGGFKSQGAPEIDPALAGGGIVLLVGGTLVLMSRRRLAKA